MADPKTPAEILHVQNLALRDILMHVVSRIANDSGNRDRWLGELRGEIAGVDAIVRRHGPKGPEATALADDVAAEVAKFFNKLNA